MSSISFRACGRAQSGDMGGRRRKLLPREVSFSKRYVRESQRQRLSVGSVGRQGSSLLELIRAVGNGTLAT